MTVRIRELELECENLRDIEYIVYIVALLALLVHRLSSNTI